MCALGIIMKLLLALCWLYERERHVRQAATATFAFAIANVVAANEQTSEPSGKCRAALWGYECRGDGGWARSAPGIKNTFSHFQSMICRFGHHGTEWV